MGCKGWAPLWTPNLYGQPPRAATPGSTLPSIHSRNAPPAVEMKVKSSAAPAWFRAETVSPPPATDTSLPSRVRRAATWAAAVVAASNGAISKAPSGPFQIRVLQAQGLEGLRRKGWYLVSSNHQSWVDILVLQKVFHRRVPFLKFFLKRQLLYVPVMGLAWWALDFPFMRRRSGSRTRDLATARQACEKFRQIPTSVMNFLEGTRFSAAKRDAQGSPYRHLLKPKVGGLATALSAMGERFDALLDVTIVYPHGVPTFWDLLSGKLWAVVVRVRERAIPVELLAGDYEGDPVFRARMQAYVHDLWTEKDRHIEALLGDFRIS